VVDSAGRWSEGLCHCRHVARHTGRPCVHPEGHCLALGMGVEYLVRAGIAKRIDKARAREVLAYSRDNGLVMMADNVKRKPTFICNCCGCCCEMLHGIRMLKDMRHAVVTSGWVASPSDEGCNGCGACASACPIEAIDVVPATASGEQPKRKKRAVVRGELCLGCGVCKRACKRGSMTMRRLPARVRTPETMMEKMMVQALERGKLQHLLFDDPSRLSHRVLGAFVGMALNAPPARRYLLRDNVKSRFVKMLSEATFKSPAGWVAKL